MSLYEPAHHKKYSEIVTFASPSDAFDASKKLIKECRDAKTCKKKLTILKVVNLAASRALGSSKRKNIKPTTRDKLEKVAKIYRQATEEIKQIYVPCKN